MKNSANCFSWAPAAGAKRAPMSDPNRLSLYRGVYVTFPLIGRSLSAQMYCDAGGRYCGGFLSHRKCRSAGGLTFEQSAKALTRLYRNGPRDWFSAYLPVVPWNQTMYAAIGTTPATSSVTRRRQPTRRISMATRITTSSGWPTDLTTVA